MQFILLALFAFLPTAAFAHSAGGADGGWTAGFNHPLHGWDHLVVMIAVGLWAAQHHGRARLAIPLAFVTSMAFGGIVGSCGLTIPFIEPAILFSVIALSSLVLLRRTPTRVRGMVTRTTVYAWLRWRVGKC